MINFFKNLFSVFNTRNKSINQANIICQFTSISINHQIEQSTRSQTIVQLWSSDNDQQQYDLSFLRNEVVVKMTENNKLISINKYDSKHVPHDFRNKIPQIYQRSIEQAKNILLQGSTLTSDLTNESKGLEWLRVSMLVLKEAIKKSINSEGLFYTGQFFSGHRKKNECFQLRIKSLSLDFLLLFLEDGRLNITVWNYKQNSPSVDSEPVFTGEFVKLKQQVFDEFIHLIKEISLASTKFVKTN